jgi:hypothetical protein
MSDTEVEKLKAEIDKIMMRIDKIIKKIEADKPEDGSSAKPNKP